MNKENIKIQINNAKADLINLNKRLELKEKKLSKVRFVALSSTGIVFLLHNLGLILGQPLIIIPSLLYLLVCVSICSTLQFKYMGHIESIQEEIKNKNKLIEDYEKELHQDVTQIYSIPYEQIDLSNIISKKSKYTDRDKKMRRK